MASPKIRKPSYTLAQVIGAIGIRQTTTLLNHWRRERGVGWSTISLSCERVLDYAKHLARTPAYVRGWLVELDR